MLHPGWKRGKTKPGVVGIAAAADHIDHICQLAGSARHCALGTDLDGGFGTEQTPRDLDTHTDVHKLEGILARRGTAAPISTPSSTATGCASSARPSRRTEPLLRRAEYESVFES